MVDRVTGLFPSLAEAAVSGAPSFRPSGSPTIAPVVAQKSQRVIERGISSVAPSTPPTKASVTSPTSKVVKTIGTLLDVVTADSTASSGDSKKSPKSKSGQPTRIGTALQNRRNGSRRSLHVGPHTPLSDPLTVPSPTFSPLVAAADTESPAKGSSGGKGKGSKPVGGIFHHSPKSGEGGRRL